MKSICHSCSETHPTSQLSRPSRSRAALSVVKDWRLWVGATALCLAAGFIGGLLDFPLNPGGITGAVVALYIGQRVARLRACPSCDELLEAA